MAVYSLPPEPPPDDDARQYCFRDEETFELSGQILRATGMPHTNATLTLIVKVCESPRLVPGPSGCNQGTNPPGLYCKDGSFEIYQTTTDCNGNYAFSVTDKILGVALYLAPIEFNPTYDCAVSNLCPSGAYVDNGFFLRLQNDRYKEYPLDNVYSGSLAVDTFPDLDIRYRGSVLMDRGYYALIGGSTWQDILCTGNYTSLPIPCQWVGGAPGPIPRAAKWNDTLLTIRRAAPVTYHVGDDGIGRYFANYIYGSYVLNIRTNSNPVRVRAAMVKDGKWWYVDNVQIRLTDACGVQTTLVTNESFSSKPCGANTQVVGTFGWAGVAAIDWARLTNVEVLSGAPTACDSGCGSQNAGFGPGVPPSLKSGGPYPVHGTQAQIYPTRDARYDNLYHAGYWGNTLSRETPNDPGLATNADRTVMLVRLDDCQGAAAVRLQADTFQDILCVAWVDSANGLRTAMHLHPLRRIGESATGWNDAALLESANVSDIGMVYLPSGTLYLTYDLSGAKKHRLNRKLGVGVAGDWSAAATPTPNVSRHSVSRRTRQRLAYRFRALGNAGAGNIECSIAQSEDGSRWSSGAVCVGGAYGPYCGGAFLNNGYGLLYTRDSDKKVFWLTTGDPGSWSGAGTDTGMTGIVVGLTEAQGGLLVGLIWDATSKRCRACRSRDRGKTWVKDATDIAAIPALDTPPALTVIQHTVFAVFVTGDQPRFAASVDGGVTWA